MRLALLLLHVYIGVRLLPALGLPAVVAGSVALAALFWLLPKGFRIREERPWLTLTRWLGLGFFSWLLVLTLARDASLALTHLFASAATHAAWVRESALGVLVASPLITLIGFVMARRVARVVDVDVPVEDLPESLHGFTIAQISDIHVGPTIKRRFVEGVVERVNRVGVDMVAISGDLVDGSVGVLAPHTGTTPARTRGSASSRAWARACC